jgi:predicted regulator of Ras-like GTPase activity (Roadblock/LC7/MglB family)
MPNVVTATLVSDAGLEVESVGGAVVSPAGLAAETASLVRVTSNTSKQLRLGHLFRVAFTTDAFEVISIRVGNKHSLTVAAQRGADLRNLQIEMARLALQLVQDLE